MARILLCIFILLFCPCLVYGYGQPLNLTPAQKQALNEALGKVPGEVVFSSLRDGKWRLFRINADGSNLSRLSLGPANYTDPTFILHGSKLIYHSDENGPMQIFMANPDMSEAICLSPGGKEERFAGLSFKQLMLVYRPVDAAYYLRPLHSGAEVKVNLPDEFSTLPAMQLRLAPNGSRLLAVVKPEDNQHGQGQMYVFTLNPVSGHTVLYRALGAGDFANWRSDSEALVFVRAANLNQSMGTTLWFWEEGGQGQQLTDDLSWNIDTTFALNGPGLVWAKAPLFTRDPASGRYDIWLQREHGQALRLTQHSAPDAHPTWRAQVGQALHQGVDFVFDARQYATFRGITVPDQDSPGGQALQSAAVPGLLVLTAAEMLPPGWYQARFRLKLVNANAIPPPPGTPVALLQVVSQAGQKDLASVEILAGNFTGQGYNLFPLQFSLEQLSMGLQIKVHSLQENPRLQIDTIFLQSEAPAPWYAPVMELWREWPK